MTGYAIRPATPADEEVLASLGAGTFVATFGHLYARENLEKFLEKNHSRHAYRALLEDPSYATWIAETETGAAVGYAVAGPCTLPVPDMPANSGELVRLYLVDEAKGAGLGGRLLDTSLDFLRRRFSSIYLSVYRDNLIAQRLYSRAGFVKIHDYFYMVGDHADPEYIMELKSR
ncbi:MAG: GNAT family N-acetyltransferase [Parvularculaceae bacterium]|nr:GNAT family N-acetyltransferase [Parvularculaceae bacterium]